MRYFATTKLDAKVDSNKTAHHIILLFRYHSRFCYCRVSLRLIIVWPCSLTHSSQISNFHTYLSSTTLPNNPNLCPSEAEKAASTAEPPCARLLWRSVGNNAAISPIGKAAASLTLNIGVSVTACIHHLNGADVIDVFDYLAVQCQDTFERFDRASCVGPYPIYLTAFRHSSSV